MKAFDAVPQRVVPALVCLALVAGVPAIADQQVQESREVAADALIEVSNVSGSLTVTGWDRERVEIEGTLGKDVERLEISGDEQNLRIKVILPKNLGGLRRHEGSADLTLRVPVASDLDLSTVSADIDVRRFSGSLQGESVSGDVSLDGRMKIIEVATVSGEIGLHGSAPRIKANSISGDVDIDGTDGMTPDIQAETVSGDIRIGGTGVSGVDVSSVSGDLILDGSLEESGSYDFSAHSGDIHLLLPADTDARFQVSTFSGDIDNRFSSESPERRSRFTPGSELDFTTGKGRARVRIETFSGDVLIEKR